MLNMDFILNKQHPSLRLNTVCPYFTMFPLSFPFKVLSATDNKNLVYDPFCGRGTTNYAARLLGLKSYGVDSNPVAFAIAQAKLVDANPKQIYNLCKEIVNSKLDGNLPVGDFWQWGYQQDTLIDICKLRNYFLGKSELNKIEIALRAIILGVLHGPLMKSEPSYLSNQMPRTFASKPDYSVRFWQKRDLIPQYVNVSNLIKRKAEYIFNNQTPKKVDGHIVLGDSRYVNDFTKRKFDFIITSPPYYGMATYEQDQWLRNWFMGGPEKVNYSSKSQIVHWSESSFINDLAKVWLNSAEKCKSNAKLVIRFGALPSKSAKGPCGIITESLFRANCGWQISKIENAGKPNSSNRQANQFKNTTGNYIEEIDVYASLNL